MSPESATDAVARLTGRSVARAGSGGAVTRVTLDDGTEVVAKRGEPTATAAEAAGLRWLAGPGTVAVPTVLGADERWLVSEAVGSGSPSAEAAAAFGRDLAALHAAGADAFGAPPPDGPAEAWIGGAGMRNDPAPAGTRWIDWYVDARVLPYVRQARDGGGLSSSQAATISDACARLTGGDADAGPDEPPARLHGDLWSGNVLWDGARAWVIDPAAHGGHRETDLAMLALFGCPHLDAILDAYDDAAPLAPGWRGRVGLHQLFPLLVHAALFGGGYGASAAEAARRV